MKKTKSRMAVALILLLDDGEYIVLLPNAHGEHGATHPTQKQQTRHKLLTMTR